MDGQAVALYDQCGFVGSWCLMRVTNRMALLRREECGVQPGLNLERIVAFTSFERSSLAPLDCSCMLIVTYEAV
jgi:hypothetical protein